MHELTDEVNQNVTKAQILYELSKSIAASKNIPSILIENIFIGDIFSAIAADGFNLYLVDESGTSMRLFTAENDE